MLCHCRKTPRAHCPVLSRTILYCLVLSCPVLSCTVLYCYVLHVCNTPFRVSTGITSCYGVTRDCNLVSWQEQQLLVYLYHCARV